MRLLAVLALALGLGASQRIAPLSELTNGPSVILEKTRYVVGEPVFLWLQFVNREGADSSILDGRRVIWTRPDGTSRIDQRVSSLGGLTPFAFERGGWRLGEVPQVGQWTVIYEVAGTQSAPVSFTVEARDILDRITAQFVVSSLPALNADSSARFVVRNQLSERIRFPILGELSVTNVSVRLSRTTGERWDRSYALNREMLREAAGFPPSLAALFSFDWDTADTARVISVEPGGSYELTFSLAGTLSGGSGSPGAIPAGEYELRLSTELPVLIGSRDGVWKDFSPIRVPVSSAVSIVVR